FANSPLYAGRPTGWRCTRQAIRLRALTDHDPRRSGAGYRSGALSDGAPLDGAPFDGAGLDGTGLDGTGLDGAPFDGAGFDAAPSGGILELDMIDAQPGDGWRVAVAVVTALVGDARAADEAVTATEDLPADVWIRAARFGLTDQALAEAARHCFVAAYGALARQGVDRDLRDAVAAYLDRYVNRSRSPADDLLRPTTTRT
ncbi:MAG TPA: glutamylcysteine synthetase, partial [Actinoplanes sp.]